MPANLTPRWSLGIYHVKDGPFEGRNEAKLNSIFNDSLGKPKKKNKRKRIIKP